MAYDIIGDIHGQADKLHALLSHMGYENKSGAYRHPSRSAIFVGDFIDRGPKQIETVMTVRRMMDAGTAQAVMGNHELNAIAWHTRDPLKEGAYLRSRSGSKGRKNLIQHEAFLKEVAHKPKLHQFGVDWFMTLPLWLDLDKVRVVHACWHSNYMNELKPLLNHQNQLDTELMIQSTREGEMAFRTVETLTKGLEVRLPNGLSYGDKDGQDRKKVRIRWWESELHTYHDLAMVPRHLKDSLPKIKIDDDARSEYDGVKPVFFGHYWMKGDQIVQNKNFACVDYSAAKEGPLVAYRWDGEADLCNKNFTKV